MGNDIAQLSNDLDLKFDRLVVHITAGFGIGLPFTIRLAVKLISKSRRTVSESNQLLARVATCVHLLIKILVFTVVSGDLGITINVDMYNIIMLGETMPQNLPDLPMRIIHGLLTKLLLCALARHIIAAFYHPFVLRDKLWSRIWFGKKNNLCNPL
jgi:cytochrome b561